MSLADEITKLYELSMMGILSSGEFQAAKEGAIRRFAGGAPAPVNSSPAAMTGPPQGVVARDTDCGEEIPANAKPHTSTHTDASPAALQGHAAGAAVSVASQATDIANCAGAQGEPQAALSPTMHPLLREVEREDAATTARLFPHIDLRTLLQASTAASVDPALLETALRHLHRVCENIRNNPTATRYHRLRKGNRTLALELFSVPGIINLLHSVGFEDTKDDEEDSEKTANPRVAPMRPNDSSTAIAATTGSSSTAAQAQTHGCLRWRASEQSALLPRLEQALTAIAYLRERTESVVQHRFALLKLLQTAPNKNNSSSNRGARPFGAGLPSIPLEIRMEQARSAMQTGTLADYVATLFSRDDAGDGLYSATTHANVLATVLSAAAAAASAEEQVTLWLPLDHPVVFPAVVLQRGGLELALVGAGGTLSVRPPAAATKTANGGDAAQATYAIPNEETLAEPSKGGLHATTSPPPVGLLFPRDPCVLAHAAATAQAVLESVRAARRRLDNEARRIAEAAAATELRRERLRLARAADIDEARQAEAASAVLRRRQQRRHRGSGDDGGAKCYRVRGGEEGGSGQEDARMGEGHGSSSDDSSSSLPSSHEGDSSTCRRVPDPGDVAAGGKPRGKRVPIAEALAVLMGTSLK